MIRVERVVVGAAWLPISWSDNCPSALGTAGCLAVIPPCLEIDSRLGNRPPAPSLSDSTSPSDSGEPRRGFTPPSIIELHDVRSRD